MERLREPLLIVGHQVRLCTSIRTLICTRKPKAPSIRRYWQKKEKKPFFKQTQIKGALLRLDFCFPSALPLSLVLSLPALQPATTFSALHRWGFPRCCRPRDPRPPAAFEGHLQLAARSVCPRNTIRRRRGRRPDPPGTRSVSSPVVMPRSRRPSPPSWSNGPFGLFGFVLNEGSGAVTDRWMDGYSTGGVRRTDSKQRTRGGVQGEARPSVVHIFKQAGVSLELKTHDKSHGRNPLH